MIDLFADWEIYTLCSFLYHKSVLTTKQTFQDTKIYELNYLFLSIVTPKYMDV